VYGHEQKTVEEVCPDLLPFRMYGIINPAMALNAHIRLKFSGHIHWYIALKALVLISQHVKTQQILFT
jgi:hypothetical protein